MHHKHLTIRHHHCHGIQTRLRKMFRQCWSNHRVELLPHYRRIRHYHRRSVELARQGMHQHQNLRSKNHQGLTNRHHLSQHNLNGLVWRYQQSLGNSRHCYLLTHHHSRRYRCQPIGLGLRGKYRLNRHSRHNHRLNNRLIHQYWNQQLGDNHR